MADPADIQRLLGDFARLGTVASVDLSARTARVTIGDLLTGAIPWLTFRAGETRVSSAPSVGEQVCVLCPEADTAAGLIIGSLSSDANPDPASDASTLAVFKDGARIGYDPATHTLSADLPSGAIMIINADGGMRIKGDVEIEGGLSLSGQLYAQDAIHSDEDVTAGTVSLKQHVHTAVQPGGGVSGAPKP